jgi:hypothetical protein
MDPTHELSSPLYGYDPDSHPGVDGVFDKERSVTRTPSGKEWFLHPDFLPNELHFYRNVYDKSSYVVTEDTKIVSLWEYYQDGKETKQTLSKEYDNTMFVQYREFGDKKPFRNPKDIFLNDVFHRGKSYRTWVGYDKDTKSQVLPTGWLNGDIFQELKDYNDFLEHLTIQQREKLRFKWYLTKVKQYKPWESDEISELVNDQTTLRYWGISDEDIDRIDIDDI